MVKIKTDNTERIIRLASTNHALMEEGYKTVVAGYEGGGDSGYISYIAASKLEVDETLQSADAYDNDQFDDLKDMNNVDYSTMEDFIDAKISKIENWWDNEGGFGIMVIDLKTGNYQIDNNCYIRDVESFMHEGKIID